jgi:hypothetical protein
MRADPERARVVVPQRAVEQDRPVSSAACQGSGRNTFCGRTRSTTSSSDATRASWSGVYRTSSSAITTRSNVPVARP